VLTIRLPLPHPNQQASEHQGQVSPLELSHIPAHKVTSNNVQPCNNKEDKVKLCCHLKLFITEITGLKNFWINMMTKLQMKHQCNIVSHGKARTYLWFLGLWIIDVFLVNPVIRLERQEGLYKLQKV
jgi:hypothetical protein